MNRPIIQVGTVEVLVQMTDKGEAEDRALSWITNRIPLATGQTWGLSGTDGTPGDWLVGLSAEYTDDKHPAGVPHIPDKEFEEDPIAAPCPHCGNAWSKVLYRATEGLAIAYFVQCNRCYARGPEKHANKWNWGERDEAQAAAIREWNRRCHHCTDRAKAEQHRAQLDARAWLDHPVTKALLKQLDIIHEASGPGQCMTALETAIPHDEGFEAGQHNMVLSDNPYPPSDPRHNDWAKGCAKGQLAGSHGRATNIDEVDTYPGIQQDEDDDSLYHMYTAYADIELGDYMVTIDASYDDKIILSLNKWNGDVAYGCFEMTIPTDDAHTRRPQEKDQ